MCMVSKEILKIAVTSDGKKYLTPFYIKEELAVN